MNKELIKEHLVDLEKIITVENNVYVTFDYQKTALLIYLDTTKSHLKIILDKDTPAIFNVYIQQQNSSMYDGYSMDSEDMNNVFKIFRKIRKKADPQTKGAIILTKVYEYLKEEKRPEKIFGSFINYVKSDKIFI